MLHLTDYINNMLLEYKQDLMPKCVIIIGGPGAGKTYWMSEHTRKEKDPKTGKVEKGTPGIHEISGYKKLFGSTNVSKILDVDNNLQEVQIENAKEIAKILMINAYEDLLKSGKNTVEDPEDEELLKRFEQFLAKKESEMNKAVGYGDLSPCVDFIPIVNECKWFVEQVYKYADAKDKAKFMIHYVDEFAKKFWSPIFASDFSRREESKVKYKHTFNDKLSGTQEVKTLNNILNYNEQEEIIKITNCPSDICIAITGDKLKKITEIIDASAGRHAIYLVYLDIPEEMSIAGDAKRDRHVGPEMIHQKLESIHGVWDDLMKDKKWEKLGIWKYFRLETPVGPYPKWEVAEQGTNSQMLNSSNYNIK